MSKKIIILIVLILILFGGGFFWWWQDQADVRKLNENLPEGVRVVKSLFGREYKVINKIDGYEFKVPKEWEGFEKIKEIEYNEWKENELITREAEVGLKGEKGLLAISVSQLIQEDTGLKSFVENWSQAYIPYPTREMSSEMMSDFEVIKIQDKEHLASLKFFFFKSNSKIYRISLIEDKFIKEIILNGKW